MSAARIAGVVLSSAALVAGHGYVTGIVADGQYYGGYIVTSYPYTNTPPDNVGWATTAKDLGFVDGSGYSSGDIICHKSGEPGALSAEVSAGGEVELQWTEWPESHHGPVISYLANCNGDCSSVDKTSLEWFKIDEAGLVDGSSAPGVWAADQLIANNNSWTVTIPSSIAAGNYVLRHEIIALHSAGNENGAQNYPQCVNLKVTGGGSDTPSGTVGTKLYSNTDAGILVNIYQSLKSYEIPGPALYSGSSSGSGSGSGSGSTGGSSPAPSSTAASTPTSASSSSASISITTTPPAQTQVQAPSSTAAVPTTTAAPSPSETPTVPTPDGSSSLTDYFNSLSAEQFLSYLKETLTWLITEKSHARDLSS